MKKNLTWEERFELLVEHRDTLLLLVGDHNKTSCSDEDPNNGVGSAEYGARCQRCALLTVEASDYDKYGFDVEFNFWTENNE